MKKQYLTLWPKSLQGRLLLGTLTWIVLLVSVAGFGLYRLFQDHVYRQFEMTLQTHIDQIMADINLDDLDNLVLQSRLSNPLFEQPYSGMYWQIALSEPAGWRVVLRSTSLWDEVLETELPTLGVLTDTLLGPEHQALLSLSQELEDVDEQGQRLLITVAGDVRLVAQPLERLHRILLWSLGGLVLGLVVAALLQLFLSLYPLRTLRARLLEVQQGHSRTMQGHFPSEVQPLVEDFNAVLKANDEMVERARAQAGNLAHALKTPLSILANAARVNEPGLAALVQEQVTAAQRQVDHHLSRARASAVRTVGVRTPIYPVITSLCRVMEKIYPPIELVLEQDDLGLIFRGEEQDLQEMVGNLLDNACKWAENRVWCHVGVMQNRVQIRVEDDGPGLADEHLERIFRRGQRLDERHPGFGLGLDIVSELVQSYHGQLQAERSCRGGLCIRLYLPVMT